MNVTAFNRVCDHLSQEFATYGLDILEQLLKPLAISIGMRLLLAIPKRHFV